MKRYAVALLVAVGLLAGPAVLVPSAEADWGHRDWRGRFPEHRFDHPRFVHQDRRFFAPPPHFYGGHQVFVPHAAPVWRPGHWRWGGWGWVWVPGHWMR